MDKTLFLDRLLLTETAADFMKPNPVSIRQDATIPEAVEFLTIKGISAAPVIDDSGRPVGVLSRADIVVHDRYVTSQPRGPEFYEDEPTQAPKRPANRLAEYERVRDIMTPAVFSVTPETPASRVISDMTGLNVHHLFVVDSAGILTGVISALDLLRHLTQTSAGSQSSLLG